MESANAKFLCRAAALTQPHKPEHKLFDEVFADACGAPSESITHWGMRFA